MDQLVAQLSTASQKRSQLISDEAHQTLTLGVAFMLIASVVIGMACLWLLNRSLINPIGQLVEYIAQLSTVRGAPPPCRRWCWRCRSQRVRPNQRC